MTRMDQLLYAQLSTHAGLAALVSTRVYPEPLPQGVTFPAVTYFQVGSEFENTFGPQSPAADIQRWQFTAWESRAEEEADKYASVRAVAAQLRAAIVALADSGTVTLYSRELSSQLDLYDAEAGTYQVVVEATIVQGGG